ncbi:dockerin type I domain-containing protein [Rhodopirellula sp. SWK7]|uniref:dockerin type I domain-containing protein n=1 Tax=Rhodopirellula sp. SWK7 TaxID=595460 RepID=UPI0002BF2632|nr:dockerin type I domain-containing protein [Rhodopirellula sp. SWK7]EMI43280.1 extracellular nuclease [Rhodopirellula sp. SWK7]
MESFLTTRRRIAGRNVFRLRMEHLEPRRLLAAMTQSGLSLEDMRDEISGLFSSATIITHGFQLDGAGDSLMPLADAIVERNGGLLVDFDVNTDGGPGTFDLFESASKTGSELVLLFDWGDASNNDSAGWGEAAGDALFSIAVGLGIIAPAAGPANTTDLHFIGHSFGTAVTSDAVERLAAFEIPVDHLTYLDPHDFDQSRLPIDGSQDLDTLGLPLVNEAPVYGATVWDNVDFADVYYQTNPLGFFSTNPGGRPIPGAYNVSVTAETSEASFPHSAVWNEYYLASVNDPSSTTGYAFSSRVDNAVDRPEPRFYGSDQDHDHTPDAIANRDNGSPNSTGLDANGLTSAQITAGRWAPAWNSQINNAGFAFVGNQGSEVPGWAFHSGGGNAEITPNPDAALSLQSSNDSRTHNWTYIPNDVALLDYDITIPISITSGSLQVLIGDTLVDSLAIDQFTSLERTLAANGGLTLSSSIGSHADSVNTLTFRLTDSPSDNANITVDDVRFAHGITSPIRPRIIVPAAVATEHFIASASDSDLTGTAIIFEALSDATITATTTDATPFGRSLHIVDANQRSVGSRQGNSVFAEVQAGETYAIVSQALTTDQTITLQSTGGDASLTHLAPTNIFEPTDTNANGETTAVDALRVINELNARSNGNDDPNRTTEPFLDVDGGGFISELDALRVINYLNARGHAASEPIEPEPPTDFLATPVPFTPIQTQTNAAIPTTTQPYIAPAETELNSRPLNATPKPLASTGQSVSLSQTATPKESRLEGEADLSGDLTSPLASSEYSLEPTLQPRVNSRTLRR